MQSIDIDLAAAEIDARRKTWTDAGFVVGPLTWSEGQGEPLVSRAEAPDPYSLGVRCFRGSVEFTFVLFAPPWVDMSWLDIEAVDFAGSGEVESNESEVPDLATFGRILDATFKRWSRPSHA